MSSEREAAVIKAAQDGDQRAQDELVAAYLPLVYNIVGRALNGHADVDDVVQETMIRALRGLGSLRETGNFRSWLVAITMNQIRGHWQAHHAAPVDGALQDAHDVADPGADFVDLTIVRLGLSGQRREVAEATRWLDDDDRALLSLWWLEAAGELTRPEVAAAMALSPQHTAVRVQRMKAQLETARVVVRALAAVPRCVLLEDVLAPWDGVPSALWRKRLARHAHGCTVCSGHGSGLVPAEGLLVGLALLPVGAALLQGRRVAPVAYGGEIPDAGSAPATAPGTAPASVAGPVTAPLSVPLPAPSRGGRLRERQGRRTRRRRAGLAVAAALLVGGGGVTGLMTLSPEDDEAETVRSLAASAPPLAPAAPGTASPSASAAPSASPSPSASASASPSVSASASASPTTKAPAPRPTPSRTTERPAPPRPRPTAERPAPPASSSLAQQVTDLVNSERARNGCGPVRQNGLLDTAARRHSEDMDARDFFDHTDPDGVGPGERVTATGYRWSTYGENIARGQQSPSAVMRTWMDSPGHRANILNCSFKEIGVGVHEAPGGPWWTQVFGTSA
ncbi:sigma-70 family RNA polymerase sigma factor [Streptomyces sp. NPDC050856]|uniref:sigma-70 family RNA polymerase sigma factor n=1 Tax=Streptomyces sp. NPDC050856 TaxID=3154939 RepID=UPI00340CF1F7